MPAKKAEKKPFQKTKAPVFKAESTSGEIVNSKDLLGTKYVLYFYPKDNTAGCAKEGEGFRDMYKKFKKHGVKIFGVSRDSITSHEKFKSKYKFPFELLSDADEKLCKAFDVIQMKSLYGRKYLGVERSTFLIDEKGMIVMEWRNIKVPGHVENVLSSVEAK